METIGTLLGLPGVLEGSMTSSLGFTIWEQAPKA